MMIRSGKSGGLINLSSFIVINEEQQDWVNNRFASSALRSAASKEGLQSLYADSDEAIKRYKDFDIAKAMADQKGKFLWVRARAIDADTVNANGDYFSKEELLKEAGDKKIPAYKTFEGVPVYTNHKNDDIEQAKGKVVFAEWDEKENCVWVIFFVDEEAYPSIARGIRCGYLEDVSMGASVESGKCSVCDHEATVERDYCSHMKNFKGKSCPDWNGKKAFEYNFGIKFIELSVVGDGAFENCSIDEIYDTQEIIDAALNIKERVASIHNDIAVAGSYTFADKEDRYAYEDCLRQVANTSKSIVRLAQTAGTLVGGQIMAQEGSGQNTTVSNILQFLGINAQAGLNTLDMLNLALNFLEVTVMNLFARKDNIDLAHVAKITKSMGDLQSTMQDMIDDGVENGPSGQAPLNQNALQQGAQQPQAPAPTPGQPAPDYASAGNVGRAIGPMPTQNQAFVPSNAVGGGVLASTRKNLILWDSPDKEKREVFASVKGTKENKLVRLGESLVNFAETIGINPAKRQESNIDYKIQSTSNKMSGGKNMDMWDKFKANRLVKDAALVSMDFNVDDSTKNYRVSLSTDGSIKAFYKGARMNWEPELSDPQIDSLNSNKGAEVAAELLRQFKKAQSEGRVVTAWQEPSGVYDEVREKQQEEVWSDAGEGSDDEPKELLLDADAGDYGRQKEDNRTREELLKDVRKGTPALGKVKEQELQEDAGLYKPNFVDDKVRELLLNDARRGASDKVIEQQLDCCRAQNDECDTTTVVNAAINSLADAVVTAKVSPTEVIKSAMKIAQEKDLTELLTLASLGTKYRVSYASKNSDKKLTATAAIYHALGERISDRVSAADMAETLVVLASQGDKIKDSVVKLAQSKKDNTFNRTVKSNVSKEDRIKAVISAHSNSSNSFTKEDLKAAITAFASSSIDTGNSPKEIVASIAGVDEHSLIMEVEMARTASAIEARQMDRERTEFWGQTRTASKENVCDNVIGWLADYADAYELKDTTAVVRAAKKVVESPNVAIKLAQKMINYRTADIEVTDEETKTKRIVCRVEDLDGMDIKGDDFQNQFREKAMNILTNNGYQVDPTTFTLSDVTVSADGNVTANVTSRWSRTTKVDAVAPAPVEGEIVETIEPMTEPGMEEKPEHEIAGITPQVYDEGDTLMTASAKEYRKAKRAEILSRYAQAGPPMAGGMGAMPMAGGPGTQGAMGGAGGVTPPLDGALGANADQGVSALTGGQPDMEEENVDEEPTPGQKKPWGSICPQCGSSDVDVANGEGNCQSCGAQLEYTFSVNVKPGNDQDKLEEGGEETESPENPFGADMGLGAATAPAPTAPAGPAGMPGVGGGAAGAPPIMASVSWLADSDVFVRLASPNYNKETERTLPVGFICPSCGNRDVVKHKGLTYCHACPTIAKSIVTACKEDPTKVRVSIKWLG